MNVESITITVEPERKNLSKININPISRCMDDLISIHGNFMFSSLDPDQKIIIEHKKHPVFEGFVSSYREHRPITISPDIIWLLIIQAFSTHVTKKAEELRSMFVNFTGKKDIRVEGTGLNFITMKSSDWEKKIFPKFIDHISEYTGQDVIDTLTPNFSTTTPISLAVGQLTIMSTMKHYFNYTCSIEGCGFPYITIEGTLNDWVSIKTKLSNLAKYRFNWFTKKTLPIIEKIIDTKKGKIDKNFWKDMIRIKDGKDYYDPSYVDGWFVSFFPFDKNGDILLHDKIFEDDELRPEMQEIPFLLKLIDEETVTFSCIFLAGFVGLSQNEKTASIKPEIGWFIKKLSLEDQCRSILDHIKWKSPNSILKAREKILLLIEQNKNDPYVSRATEGCETLKKEAEKLQKENVNDSSDSDSDYIICNAGADDVDDKKIENKSDVDDEKIENKSDVDDKKIENKSDVDDEKIENKSDVDDEKLENKSQQANSDQPNKSKKKSTCCLLI